MIGNAISGIGNGSGDEAILISTTDSSSATVNARISDNQIGAAGAGNGIRAEGLEIRARGSSVWHVAVTNNTFTNTNTNGDDRGAFFARTDDSATLNLDIRGNNVVSTNDDAYELTESGGTFNLEGTEANAFNQVSNNNTGTPVDINGTVNVTSNAVNDNRIPLLVGDFVWDDANFDGIQQGAESGLQHVRVDLAGTETFSGLAVNRATVTSSAGRYLFGVVPGNYTATVTPPSGLAFSPQDQGIDDTIDSDFSPAGTAAVILTAAGGDDLTIDAGLTSGPPPGPRYDFTNASFAVIEGDTTSITNVTNVVRSGDTSVASDVDVVLSAGALNPATPGLDFTAGPITISFSIGDTLMPVPIEVLGDLMFEADETIDLSFTNFTAGGAAGTTQPTATLTLQDDDGPTSVRIDGAGNLVVRDEVPAGKDDTLTVQFDGLNIVVTDPNNVLAAKSGVQISPNEVHVPLVDITGGRLDVLTLEGSDSLTVDHAILPLPLPTTYDGGTDFDTLRVNGDSAALSSISFTPGSVTFQGQPVDFSGTEATFISGTVEGVVNVPAAGGPSQVDIVAPTPGTAEVRIIKSGGTNTVIFDDLGGAERIVINASTGDDTVVVNAIDPAFNADLSIDLDGGADNVEINTSSTIRGLSITNSDTLTLNSDLNVGAGGLSLTATGNLTWNSNNIIVAGDADFSTVAFSSTGELRLNAAGAQTLTTGANDFDSVVVDSGTTTVAGTLTASSLTVAGGATLRSDNDVTVRGDTTLTGTLETTAAGPAALVIDNAAGASLDAGANTLASFTKNGPGTLTLQSDVVVASGGSFVQTAGLLDLSNHNLTIGGDVTLTTIANPGLISITDNANLSTNNQNLSGGLRITNGTTTVQGFKPLTAALIIDLGGTLNVGVHGVDVAAGGITGAGTLDASGGGDVDTGGGLTVGTYTNGAGTLTFDGTGAWGSATEQDYGRVTVDTGTVTLVGDVLTTGDLTIASTLDLNGQTLRAEGDLSVVPGGSLTAGAGSGVTFSGAASPQIVSLAGTPVTFGDVRIDKAAASDVVQISGPVGSGFELRTLTVDNGVLDLGTDLRVVGGAAPTVIGPNGTLRATSTPDITLDILSSNGTDSLIVNGGTVLVDQDNILVNFAEGRRVDVNNSPMFSISGNPANPTTLRDPIDNATTWTIEVDNATFTTFDNLSVIDSDATLGQQTPLIAGASTFDSNTIGWAIGRIWIGAGGDDDWSNGANWTGGTVPSATEPAVFSALSNLAPNQPATNTAALGTIGSLIVLPNYTQTATLDGGLTLTSDLRFNGSGGGEVNLGGQTITVGGDVSATGAFGGGAPASEIRITGANATLTLAAGATIDATLSVASGSTLTPQNSTTLDVDALTVDAGGALDVSAQDPAVSISGDLTLAGSGALTADAGTITVGGNWTSAGGADIAGASLRLDGAQITVAASDSFGNVVVGGTLTQQPLSGTLTVGGTLDISAATGTLTLDGGGLITVNPLLSISGFGIDLNGADLTAQSGLVIQDTVTLNGGNLDVNGAVLTGIGTLDASGGGDVDTEAGLTVATYTKGTGTLTFDGGGNWVGGSDFGDVVVSGGTVTTTSPVTTDDLTIDAGTSLTLDSGATVNGITTITGGTLSVRSASSFNGPASVSGADVFLEADTTFGSNLIIDAGGRVQNPLSAAGLTFAVGGQAIVQSGSTFEILGPGADTTVANVAVSTGGTFLVDSAGGALRVEASANFFVADDAFLSLAGAPDNELRLRSTVPGLQWLFVAIDPSDLDIRSVDVQDSDANASTAPIVAFGSIDAGNNLNWVFPTTLVELSPGGELLIDDIGSSSGSLTGDTVNLRFDHLPTPFETAVVGPGPEFLGFESAASGGSSRWDWDVDIQANIITAVATTLDSFGGTFAPSLEIGDLDWVPAGAVIDTVVFSNTFSGCGDGPLIFTDNSVFPGPPDTGPPSIHFNASLASSAAPIICINTAITYVATITTTPAPGKNDTITIQFDAGSDELVILDPNNTLGTRVGTQVSPNEVRVPRVDVSGNLIRVTTGGGLDELTVDHSLDPLPLATDYDGGPDNDVLNVVGDGSALSTISFTPGSVTFAGQPVDFSGTEASFLSGAVTAIFVAPNVANVVSVSSSVPDTANIGGTSGGTPFTDFNSVQIPDLRYVGGTADDTLVVDFSNLNPIAPSGGIDYDGGSGAGSDDLIIEGGILNDVIYDATGPGAGDLSIDDGTGARTIAFENLEPVLMNFGSVANIQFILPAGPDVASLEDDASPANNRSRLRSATGSFETPSFTNPTASLSITSGAGDIVVLDTPDPAFGPADLFLDGTGRYDLASPGGVPNGTNLTLDTNAKFDLNGLATGAASTVNVNSGAVLIGAGTVGGPLNVNGGGTVSPGSSPAIIGTGDLAFAAGAAYQVELDGTTAGSGHDQLDVSGTVALGGATLNATLGFIPTGGDSFTIIANDGADLVIGTFSGLPDDSIFTISGFLSTTTAAQATTSS